MEKKSQEWLDKFRNTLGEKYKYILTSELKNYEVLSCFCDEVILDKDDELMEISLDIHVDFMGGCNGDSYSIGYMINQINDDLRDVLYKFIVDKKTLKFRKASDNDPMLTDGLFIDFIYKIDEKHEAKIYYKYEYDEYL